MARSNPYQTVHEVIEQLKAISPLMMTDDAPGLIRRAIAELEARQDFVGFGPEEGLQRVANMLESMKPVPTMNRRAAERVRAWAKERGYKVVLKRDKSEPGSSPDDASI